MNNQPQSTSPNLHTPPWLLTTGFTWYSVTEFARRWDRAPFTIRRWCMNGTLISASCRVYRDIRGRWWIGVPDGN